MATVVLKSLMKRLDAACRSALDGAAGLCVARTNAAVEIEHWVAKLAESTDTDFALILEEFGINRSRVMGDALRSLERFRPTEPRPPVLSGQLVELVREAWLVASINFESPVIRSGHLLLALLTSEVHGQIAESISREFGRISIEDLKNRYAAIVSSSSEEAESRVASANSNGTSPIVRDTATPALDQYTIDLTEQARSGKIDPIVGRDSEIRQMIDILTRRRQNNPVIVGEAGVGKTAVVEGLALKIAHEAVPHVLRNVSLRSLDLGLLQAGASVRGEFESRLRGVIDEVKASTTPIILFIDEAHMLIGAGGPAGQGDAANLLKPALARGELRTIAATTWSEYKKIFEQDAALTRRFQLIKVDEPDDEKATAMMRGIVPALSLHHQVDILDEAIRDSVRMSRRYLPGRQLPDKSVSLLDTACARVALGQMCAPPAVEDCEQAIDQLGVEIDFLEAEAQTGREEPERLAKLKERRRLRQEEWAVLNDRWKEEETLVKRIREVRASVTQADGPAEAVPNPEALKELRDLERQLKAVQGQRPLVEPFVSSSVIASVISEWTGIPVGRMLSDEVDTVLRLPEFLKKRVVGQDHALEMTAQRIKSSRAGLTDPGKPIGVFLFVGPSGWERQSRHWPWPMCCTGGGKA